MDRNARTTRGDPEPGAHSTRALERERAASPTGSPASFCAVVGAPPLPSSRQAQDSRSSEVGTLLLPALLSNEIDAFATQAAEATGKPLEHHRQHFGALVGRLSGPWGWRGSDRHVEAEPLWTDRARPFDSSTSRKWARSIAAQGGKEWVARIVEGQVEKAANDADTVTAFTDHYDQVYWTKKSAHAGPIGSLNNRVLACTYIGTTFVRVGKKGPILGYSISWHKPASPLRDGLEALYQEPRRRTWLTKNVDCHTWDRGGEGAPTRRWAKKLGIPYLTIGNKATHWTRYKHPSAFTSRRVPIFLRRDEKVGTAPGVTLEQGPRVVIFPASPDKGKTSTRSLRYFVNAKLSGPQLRNLDEVYKDRWPVNENAIKALVGAGFGINRDRTFEVTTGRGHDGARARLDAKDNELQGKKDALNDQPANKVARTWLGLDKRQKEVRKKRDALDNEEPTKGARMPTGSEWMCKYVMFMIHNAVALLLARSPLEPIRVMTFVRLRELLLGRPMLASLSATKVTLWVDAFHNAADQRDQAEVVRLFNDANLQLRGVPLRIGLRDPPCR